MKLLISFLFLFCVNAQAEVLRGLASTITDGDTIVVSDGAQSHKVRLNGIDAPELSQSQGPQAREMLRLLIEYKPVTVIWSKRDRYGRVVGIVIQGKMDIGLHLISTGYAWYFRKYESDVPEVERELYATAEAQAKAARIGLWSENAPTPPWEIRHPEEAPTPPFAPPPLTIQSALESIKQQSGTSSSSNPAPARSSNPAPASTASSVSTPSVPTATYRNYSRGPRGGCYYYSGSRKVYVDRSLCN